MPISIRLPPRVERKLAEYCALHKMSKSEAVKCALEHLLEGRDIALGADPLASRFAGSDPRPGDVARHTKRLLRRNHRRC